MNEPVTGTARIVARVTVGLSVGLMIAGWPALGVAQQDKAGKSSAAKTAGDPPIVYVDGTKLHALTRSGDNRVSFAIVDTGAGAIASFTARGHSVLIDKGGQLHWAVLPVIGDGQAPSAVASSHKLNCRAPARISSAGQHVACVAFDAGTDGAGTGEAGALRVFAIDGAGVRPVAIHESASATGSAQLAFAGDRLLVADGQNELWSLSLTDASERERVAPQAPEQHLFGGTDGQRAVGWFSVTVKSGEQVPALHALGLDGRGIRRRLMKWAVPVDWSQDGQWLLVQRGKRACLVRAVGGHYKCWRGYQALSISAHGERLLLGRPVGPDGEASVENWSAKGYRGERGIVAVRESADGKGGEKSAGRAARQDLRVYSVATGGVQPMRPGVVLSRVDGMARYVIAPAGK